MERGSYLGRKISRLGNLLKKTTASRINDYKKRLSSADACYEPLLKNLIVDNFSKINALETAKKFFNTDQIKFVAIDGTEYSNPLFDMIVVDVAIGMAISSTNFIQPDAAATNLGFK